MKPEALMALINIIKKVGEAERLFDSGSLFTTISFVVASGLAEKEIQHEMLKDLDSRLSALSEPIRLIRREILNYQVAIDNTGEKNG